MYRMNPRFIAYLDYLLKNSSTPRMMKIEWERCSDDERQQIISAEALGDFIKGAGRGEYYIANKMVYDKMQDVLWHCYVDFENGHRGQRRYPE